MTDEIISEHPVKPLELFFDLVFVLAFTQVTTQLAHDLTWNGLFRALLEIIVLWWAWAGFAWLTNAFDAESRLLRLPVFVAIGALLIVSLALPNAFGEDAVLFAVGYLVVRLIHQVFYLVGARGDRDFFRAVFRMSPAFIAAPVLLLISAFFDGSAQAALWVLAIAIDYGGAYALGGEGWQLAPEHFSERFGLIVIIALGESIVSIGVGAGHEDLGLTTITAALLAVTLASAFWWMYFDVLALVAARELVKAEGIERIRLARDTYAVLHLPLIAGIILVALSIKLTIAHPEDHLATIPAVAAGIGGALYAGGLSVIKLRDVGSLNYERLLLAAFFLASIPVAEHLPALASLAIFTGVCVAVVTFEAIRFKDTRVRVREEAS